MARSVIESTPGFGVDTRDLTDLAVAMRRASVVTAREWRLGMRGVGEIIAVEARHRASEHSKSIPPTIKVRAARGTVEVRAGSNDAPLARLFELGNSGGKSSIQAPSRGGRFKHPVFGDMANWVFQDMHPFLYAAGKLKEQEARDELAEVIAHSLREVGVTTETY
jgi:hypothetical protein